MMSLHWVGPSRISSIIITALERELFTLGHVQSVLSGSPVSVECSFNSGSTRRPGSAGEALGCVPRLEILDLSWNGGVGGGGLQGLLGKVYPPLREIRLVACQLSAADATALGNKSTS